MAEVCGIDRVYRKVIREVRRCIQPSVASAAVPLIYMLGGQITRTSPRSCILNDGIRFHNGRTHLGEERETIWARWRDHQDNRFYQDSSNECRRYLWALVTRAPAPPLIGISIGLLISFLLTALLKAQLLGVTSTDV